MEAILSVRLSTLKHVPKVCRRQWADCLSSTVRGIIASPTSSEAWCKLFLLPKAILHSPPRGGAAQWKRLGKTVADRLKRWANGDIIGLWHEVRDAPARRGDRRPPASTPNVSSLRIANARRCRTAVGEGQIRKGVNCLLSRGLGAQSPEILLEMQQKHPRGCLPLPNADPPPSAEITATHLEKALQSFPASSAPGPSGLRPTHLKEAVFEKGHTNGNSAATSLLDFCWLMVAGQLPSAMAPFFCGATLLAAIKKDGSHRPIAVGEVLRRLVCKCLSFAVRRSASSTLSPLQVGVGVPNGCEAIIHAASKALEDGSIPPDSKWVLALDWSNAFNSISRQSMYREVRARAQGLAAWVESAYSTASLLRFGDHSLTSEVGVQQGDPLGPLIFSLALQPLIEKINQQVPRLKLNAWYLDDGTMMGSPEDLAMALHIAEELGPTIGLQVNRSKTTLFVPEGANPERNCLPCELPVSTSGLLLLGAPVGAGPHLEAEFTRRVEKTLSALARLPDLEDPHIGATLLRHSLSFPRIGYALRTCPPYAVAKATAQYDDGIREALATLVGSPLPTWSWEKAGLPTSLGGLGLRSAVKYGMAAHLGSLGEAAELVGKLLKLEEPPPLSGSLVRAFAESVDESWQVAADLPGQISQGDLALMVDRHTHKQLLLSAPDVRSKALLNSTSLPKAGAWLASLPSAPLGLHLRRGEFVLCLRYWLGLPLFPDGQPCPVCHEPADIYGDHQVGCGATADRIRRHNLLREVLFSTASSAALAPLREVPGLIAGSQSRPADVFLPAWTNGGPTALDVTVVSPMQKALIRGAASTAGHALQHRLTQKLSKHDEACRREGISFVPLVVETLGGCEDGAIAAIRKLAAALASRSGVPSATTANHLFQRLAMALWRGNAAMWLRRSVPLPPHVDGLM